MHFQVAKAHWQSHSAFLDAAVHQAPETKHRGVEGFGGLTSSVAKLGGEHQQPRALAVKMGTPALRSATYNTLLALFLFIAFDDVGCRSITHLA